MNSESDDEVREEEVNAGEGGRVGSDMQIPRAYRRWC